MLPSAPLVPTGPSILEQKQRDSRVVPSVVGCPESRTIRDLMTKLSMHESLPFDEATAPSLVSTGELPQDEQVRDVVTEATSAIGPNGDGAVADYIPALASASPGCSGSAWSVPGAGPSRSVMSRRRSQSRASRSRSSSRWSARRSGTRRRDISWASTAQDSRSTR